YYQGQVLGQLRCECDIGDKCQIVLGVDDREKCNVGEHLGRNVPDFNELEPGEAIGYQKPGKGQGIGDDEKPHHQFTIACAQGFVSASPNTLFSFGCHRCIHNS